MEGSDLALLDLWRKRRDADSFAEIVSRHSAMVFNTCRRILGDAAEAEDVAQECFLQLARSGSAIRSSPGSWLHAVATRLSINCIRSRKRRAERETLAVRRPGPGEEAERAEVREAVDAAIASLPEKLRAPIIARFLEGRTYESIAASLGVPPSTIASRLDRGIEAIRAALRRRGIAVAGATLGALMAVESARAAPPSLLAELGRMALAGDAGLPPGSAAGGTLLMVTMKKAAIAVVAALVLIGGGLLMDRTMSRRPAQDEEHERPPAAAAGGGGAAAAVDLRKEPSPAAPLGDGRREPERAEEPAPAVRPATVSGRVTDRETGAPIAGAHVHLEVCRDRGVVVLKTWEATTDGDGAYRIAGIDAFASVSVFAVADGHAMGLRWGKEVAEGSELTGVDVVLREAVAAIGGRVVTEANEPVAGASVQVRCYGYSEDELEEVTAKTGGTTGHISDGKLMFDVTDADGTFSIAFPVDGLGDLSVIGKGHVPAFFPRVPIGAEDLLLVLPKPGTIEGTVAMPDGRAAAGIRVEATGWALPGGLEPSEVKVQRFRLAPIAVETDAGGRFAFSGLSEDHVYDVAARSEADGTERTAQRNAVLVHAGETTRGIDLVLEPVPRTPPPAIVRGTVRSSRTGLPLHPVMVFASRADSKKPDREVLGGIGNVMQNRPDGTYEIGLDLAGPTEVRVFWRHEHPGGWGPFLAEVEFPRAAAAPGRECVVDLSAPEPCSVAFRFVGRDGAPREGIRAAIRMKSREMGLQGANLFSGSDGRVVWEGLTVGETYQALAVTEKAAVLGSSRPFAVRAGETTPEVEVVCVPRGSIAGIATDRDGNPLGSQLLICTVLTADAVGTKPQDLDWIEGRTDARGAFRFAGLPEGVGARIAVVHPESPLKGLAALVEDIAIDAGGTTDVGTLVLRPATLEDAARILGGK